MRVIIVFLVLIISVLYIYGENDVQGLLDNAEKIYNERYLNSNSIKECFDIVKAVLEKNPKNIQANYEMAKLYLKFGDSSENKDEKRQ